MKPFRIARRSLLRGAGVAIGLPLLEAMTPLERAAGAAAGAAPKRLVVIFSPNGSLHENWVPSGTETSFTLSRILAPLATHQSSLVIVDGVRNSAAQGEPYGDDHDKGIGIMLTGRGLLSGSEHGGCTSCLGAGLADGISVDQAIANAIGKDTKLKSLELGVQTGTAGKVYSYMCYAGSNQPLPPDNNPTSVFNRLFADLGSDSSALERLRAERKSVLDAVIQSFGKLNGRLGAEDKQKLDAHLATIRDLETRLTATAAQGAECVKPTPPASLDYKLEKNFPTVGKLQMDLLVMALACDLTRVASLQWAQAFAFYVPNWVDASITRDHHTMSHDGDDNADTVEKLTKVNAWYAEQLRYLLDAMQNVNEGGGTLLDNSLIFWGNELGRGNSHSHANLPYVLAGGAGGSLRTGRFVQYAQPASNNDFLVSLMNLMDVPATTFGDPKYVTGPLSGL